MSHRYLIEDEKIKGILQNKKDPKCYKITKFIPKIAKKIHRKIIKISYRFQKFSTKKFDVLRIIIVIGPWVSGTRSLLFVFVHLSDDQLELSVRGCDHCSLEYCCGCRLPLVGAP